MYLEGNMHSTNMYVSHVKYRYYVGWTEWWVSHGVNHQDAVIQKGCYTWGQSDKYKQCSERYPVG